MNPYTVEVKGKVMTVRFSEITAGWEQWIFLRSDAHHDSVLCNRALEADHLNEAKRKDALILSMGDDFDCMQGSSDRRRSYDEVRPEDKCNDYFGSIVRHASEDYAAYAPNWLLLAKGNHETAVEKYSNLCLTTMLADKLRSNGSPVRVGGHSGWVRFMFGFANTRKSSSLRLRYYHGGGAAAPITRGVIDQVRQAAWLPDADVIVNGHKHTSYLMPLARERLNDAGQVLSDKVWLVRTPGYKGRGQWEEEKGFAPEPHGAAWLHLSFDGGDTAMNRVRLEPSLAIG